MPKDIEIFRNYISNKPKGRQLSVMTSSPASIAVIGELNVDLIASGLPSAPVLGRELLRTFGRFWAVRLPFSPVESHGLAIL